MKSGHTGINLAKRTLPIRSSRPNNAIARKKFSVNQIELANLVGKHQEVYSYNLYHRWPLERSVLKIVSKTAKLDVFSYNFKVFERVFRI